MTSNTQDDAALLTILQSHGQQFIEAFGDASFVQGSSKKRKLDPDLNTTLDTDTDADMGSDIDWEGFDDTESSENVEGEGGIDDDDFTSEAIAKEPETIVFDGYSPTSSSGKMTKTQVKAFMSSKTSKIRLEGRVQNSASIATVPNEDRDEERTNLENDALLHKLIHTQLLSKRSADATLKPAERKRAVQGRVLELAAGAKIGSGERVLRSEEHKRASKKIRLGLERKGAEREAQVLEEAKNLGNYHKSIKHLFDASAKDQPDRRKRDKGLKMGIGRFSGGVLKLSKKDFPSESGHSKSRTQKTKGKR